jgi:phytanoyl-CoA hydroxylase
MLNINNNMKNTEPAVFSLDRELEQDHIVFFKKNGFIQFKKFIDRETVSELLHEIEEVQHFLIKNHISKVNGIPLKFGLDENHNPFIQRLAFTSQYSKVLSDFLLHEKFNTLLPLLNPYHGRIGENEKDGLVVNHYINTPLSSYNKLGWHTDSPRDLFLGSRILPMLNVGLHLDDCAFANGGLRVLPGTHRQNIFRLLTRKKYFIDNEPDEKETGFDISAGDLTVHDGRLWHRVQQSSLTGEASRRRVMYIPIITGAYLPRHANSSTPFYHKLAQIKAGASKRKLNWALLKIK